MTLNKRSTKSRSVAVRLASSDAVVPSLAKVPLLKKGSRGNRRHLWQDCLSSSRMRPAYKMEKSPASRRGSGEVRAFVAEPKPVEGSSVSSKCPNRWWKPVLPLMRADGKDAPEADRRATALERQQPTPNWTLRRSSIGSVGGKEILPERVADGSAVAVPHSADLNSDTRSSAVHGVRDLAAELVLQCRHKLDGIEAVSTSAPSH